MVILGLGSDLVDIRRVARTLERFGERFTRRCFTEAERARCDARYARAEGYARRYAAKEACAKALGTGFNRGVYWRDIGVVNLPGGRPTIVLTGGALERLRAITPPGMRAEIVLTGGALERLRAITPPGMRAEIAVSLTDEPPLAQAVVVITAVPVEWTANLSLEAGFASVPPSRIDRAGPGARTGGE